jgi:hypothetical protein
LDIACPHSRDFAGIRFAYDLRIMRRSWLRRILGRSLLRERLPLRARPLAECPRCGLTLLGASEDWLDAERLVTDHLMVCEPVATVHEEAPARRRRVVLRPAM